MKLLKSLRSLLGSNTADEQGSGWGKKHQASFRENRESIFEGIFPNRYHELSKLTPGTKVLDIGSADGTFALTLSGTKTAVYGVELTKQRFETANKLKETLQKKIGGYDNCKFLQGRIEDHTNLLQLVDTVTFIRVSYYLPMQPIMEQILAHANISYILLCGNSSREERTKRSRPWSRARRQFKLATEVGMVQLLRKNGLNDFDVIRIKSTGDPVLIVRLPHESVR